VGSVIISRQWNNARTSRVSAVVSGRTWRRIIITKRGIYSPSERGGNSHDPVRPIYSTLLYYSGIGRSRKLSKNKTKNRPRPAKISRTQFRSQERTAFRNGVSKFDNLEPLVGEVSNIEKSRKHPPRIDMMLSHFYSA